MDKRGAKDLNQISPLDKVYQSEVSDSVPSRSTVTAVPCADGTSSVDGNVSINTEMSSYINERIKEAMSEPMEMLRNVMAELKGSKKAHALSSSDEYISEKEASDVENNDNNYDNNDMDDLDLVKSQNPVDEDKVDEPDEIYPDHLAGLFNDVKDDNDFGDDISDNLAIFLNAFLNRIPPKKCFDKIEAEKDGILVPGNCRGLMVPLCNSYIWQLIKSKAVKSNEKRLQNIQISFVKGLIPMARVVDELCAFQQDNKTRKLVENSISSLKISMRMFMASYTAIMDLRATNIKYSVSSDVRRIIEGDKKPSSENLFGDDLQEKVKNYSSKTAFAQKFSFEKYSHKRRPNKKRYSDYNDNYDYKNYNSYRSRNRSPRRHQFKERGFKNKSNRGGKRPY